MAVRGCRGGGAAAESPEDVDGELAHGLLIDERSLLAAGRDTAPVRQPSGALGCSLTCLALVGDTLLSIARRGAFPAVSTAEHWVGLAVVGLLTVAGVALLARAQRP